jgi:hypothetical protein
MREQTIAFKFPGPVARRYYYDDSFVTGIRGPVGSAKSTTSVFKLLRNATRQAKAADGLRHRRTAIIRNTYPELRTTTIKTWHQWFPTTLGRWVAEGPPTHQIRLGDIEWEVLFVALDKPQDVAKLLSMELSDAWINEAREVPKAILDGLTGRVSRYPAVRDGGCTCPQILMDTNPPDSDHWWYTLAEEDTPEGFSFYAQPSGLAADAENLENLDPAYYTRQIAGKSEEWVKVYVRGQYGYVAEGKAVYPEYNDALHCREFTLKKAGGLYIGLDFGLTPAATIAQRTPMGAWRIDREVIAERMGAINFAAELVRVLNEHYEGWEIHEITGDPAGNQGQAGDEEERTIFQLLAANGVIARPASSNEFSLRREAVANMLGKLVDGDPAFLLHPRCKVLRKAMGGKYQFKRVQVSGDARYQDKPDKNEFSHVAEALQYLMLGAGEGKALVRRTDKPARPAAANHAHGHVGHGLGWMR